VGLADTAFVRLAILSTNFLAKRGGRVCPYHMSQTDKAEAALNQMLYPRKMATRNEEEKKVVNRRLRRKMLERWENEGGKVGDIGPSPASTGSKKPAGVGKKRSSDTSTKIKK
jgi:hypothetical protein